MNLIRFNFFSFSAYGTGLSLQNIGSPSEFTVNSISVPFNVPGSNLETSSYSDRISINFFSVVTISLTLFTSNNFSQFDKVISIYPYPTNSVLLYQQQ